MRKTWPAIEDFFNWLSPPLDRQGVLLRQNLALGFSETGRFADILARRQDFPWLDLPAWLLDDLGLPPGPARAGFEQALLPAVVLTFAAGYTQASLLDGGSFFDESYLFLAQALSRQATLLLAGLFPAGSPFWAVEEEAQAAHSAALLAERQRRGGPLTPAVVEELQPDGRRLALARIGPAAAVAWAGRPDLLPALLEWLDHLAIIFEIRADIAAIRRDLAAGRLSYPIVTILQAAGIPLQPLPPPERVLGALVLTDAADRLVEVCAGHLAAGRAIAGELNLPALAGYLDAVAELVAGVRDFFALGARPARPVPLERNFFLPPLDSPVKAAAMAEGYLLADLTWRDSWEVHRRGLFGLPEVVARFPAGLVLEILGGHGHALAAQVDDFFQALADNNFRYYAPPQGSRPDTDNLGLLLRLLPYSPRPEAHRALLETPLAWLAASVLPSGQVPVWLNDGTAAGPDEPAALFLGDNCGTIEANLLRGLLQFDGEGYRSLIERSAGQWLARLLDAGPAGITVNYPPSYTTAVAFALVDHLAAWPAPPALAAKLPAAVAKLVGYLATAAGRRVVSPQEAAFLSLACLSPAAPPPARALFNPAWLAVLLKNQRFDGSWPAEPLFFAPNRGELMTWYASQTTTTAFCYHALQTWLDQAKP